MKQLTLTDIEYSNRKKKTKREEFLDAMEEIIPWKYWADMIRPFYFNNTPAYSPNVGRLIARPRAGRFI